MNSKEALTILETELKPCVHLNNIQEIVFCKSWEWQTYQEIAETFCYNTDYIKEVGSHLWKFLSEKFGQRITKSNFRSVIRRLAQQSQLDNRVIA